MKFFTIPALLLSLTSINLIAVESIEGNCVGQSAEHKSVQTATKEAMEKLGACLETSQSDCYFIGGMGFVGSPKIQYIDRVGVHIAIASQAFVCQGEGKEEIEARKKLEIIEKFLEASESLQKHRRRDGVHQGDDFIPFTPQRRLNRDDKDPFQSDLPPIHRSPWEVPMWYRYNPGKKSIIDEDKKPSQESIHEMQHNRGKRP